MTKIDITTCDDDVRGVARLFYERYCHDADNKNYRGEECPAWDDLTKAVQSHWGAVAKMALDQSNHVAMQAAYRTGEVFARKRIAAMRTRPRMYAATRDSFLCQLQLLAEIGGSPWPAEPSGLSPLAELQRRLCGPGAAVDTGPNNDEAWARNSADVALAFLEAKWAKTTS